MKYFKEFFGKEGKDKAVESTSPSIYRDPDISEQDRTAFAESKIVAANIETENRGKNLDSKDTVQPFSKKEQEAISDAIKHLSTIDVPQIKGEINMSKTEFIKGQEESRQRSPSLDLVAELKSSAIYDESAVNVPEEIKRINDKEADRLAFSAKAKGPEMPQADFDLLSQAGSKKDVAAKGPDQANFADFDSPAAKAAFAPKGLGMTQADFDLLNNAAKKQESPTQQLSGNDVESSTIDPRAEEKAKLSASLSQYAANHSSAKEKVETSESLTSVVNMEENNRGTNMSPEFDDSGINKKKKTVTFGQEVHASDGSSMPLKGVPNDLSEEKKARAEEKRRAQEAAERKEIESEREREAAEVAKNRPSISLSSPSDGNTKGLSYKQMSNMYKKGTGIRPKNTENGYEFDIKPGKVAMSPTDGGDIWVVTGDIKAPKSIIVHDKAGNLREVITIDGQGKITDYKGWDEKGQEVGPNESTKFNPEFLKEQGARGPEKELSQDRFSSAEVKVPEQNPKTVIGTVVETLAVEKSSGLESVKVIEKENASRTTAAVDKNTSSQYQVTESKKNLPDEAKPQLSQGAIEAESVIPKGTVQARIKEINDKSPSTAFAPSPTVNHRGENIASYMRKNTRVEHIGGAASPSLTINAKAKAQNNEKGGLSK